MGVKFRGNEYTARDILIGHYDYSAMCMPTNPCSRTPRKPPLRFAVNEPLPFFLAAVMGLQHALAMVGGLITPPLLVAGLSNDISLVQYQISASLIVSGIATIIQVMSFPIPFTRLQYGTGLLSVIGTSFTFLPLSQSAINNMLADGQDYKTAYGRILGTILVCCWTVVAFSFVPPKILRSIFPPIVTGTTIFLIGAALLTSGFQDWGGGSYCGQNVGGLPPEKYSSCLVPDAISGQLINGTCYQAAVIPSCSGNGDVELPFGAPEYLGLGALVFLVLVFIEVFGSPFMRNVEVIIALLFGYAISAIITTNGKRYVTSEEFSSASWVTFLWVHTYPIGFYAPAVLPFLVAFLVCVVEAVGDITATAEASEIATEGPAHQRRIQGGLLADGINSFWGALGTNLPSTTFAQNNGVIALTRCGSRYAGVACGIWLFLFGIIGKFAAFVTSIPDCVLGGMVTFLFANVAMSGIRIITLHGLTRKDRFIGAVSIGLGLGTTIVPAWAGNDLWNVYSTTSSGVKGIRDAVILILQNSYAIGCLSAVVLNQIIPTEAVMMPDVQPTVDDMEKVGPDGKVPAEAEYKVNPHDDSAHVRMQPPPTQTV